MIDDTPPLPPPINRAEMVADRLVENTAIKRVEPMYKTMMAVGYPKNTAIKPTQITSTERFKARLAKNALKHAKTMSDLRAEALKLMREKQGDAKYRDLTYGIDILTKNERLITGQATDNVSMQGSLVMIPAKDAEFTDDNTAQQSP